MENHKHTESLYRQTEKQKKTDIQTLAELILFGSKSEPVEMACLLVIHIDIRAV